MARVDDEPLTLGWRTSHAVLGDDLLRRAEMAVTPGTRVGPTDVALAAALAAMARAHYASASAPERPAPARTFSMPQRL